MSERDDSGIRGRLTAQAEDALGKLAQELLDNPIVTGAVSRAFEAREKAVAAQEVAMGALNLPSAADLERLTRRLRSVSQRLEGIEDGVDRLDRALAALRSGAEVPERLGRIEQQLTALVGELGQLRAAIPSGPLSPVPTAQERLQVEAPEASATKPAARRRKAPAADS